MKCIKHSLGNFDQLQILPLADLHIGDIHTDGKKINEWLAYIKDTPNCFTILNGDLCNVAIKTSLSDIYGENPMPMQQLEQCVKLFGPIKDKILAVTAGNHEQRIYKTDGLDMTQIMCNQLQIGDLYSPTSVLLFIQFGDQGGHANHWPVQYTIFAHHGSGAGGRKEGGKIQRLADLANIVDADCYLMSHTHLPAVTRTSYYRVDRRRFATIKVDRLFVNTSSTLDYQVGYGEFYAYKPNSLETPLILLDGHTNKMKAVL